MRIRSAILILMIAYWPGVLIAWGPDEAGTSAAGLVSQPGSARLLAMGGAGTAAARGAQALGWNPANLIGPSTFHSEFSFRRHFMDTELGYFSAAWPTPWGVPAIGMTYAQTRNIQGFDQSGTMTNTFQTREMDVQLAWAMAFQQFQLGVSGHFFQQDLSSTQLKGWGLDLGASYLATSWLKTALSLLRAGQTELEDPLSTELRAGLQLQPFAQMAIAVDAALPRDSEPYLAAGVEWLPWPIIALRAGWRNGPATTGEWSDLNWLTTGIGLMWQDFTLDYVFEPAGFVEDSHQITIAYHYTYRAATPASESSKRLTSNENWTPKPMPISQGHTSQPTMRFKPKELDGDYTVKEIEFTISSPEGKLIKKYHITASENMPRELIWDGTNEAGRQVEPAPYQFNFKFITSRGIIERNQTWPLVEIGHKLFFKDQGLGIEPEVLILCQHQLDKIARWEVSIAQQHKQELVRSLSGKGPLPARILWDGRQQNGDWASPNSHYALAMTLTNQAGEQTVIQKNILSIPAQVIKQTDDQLQIKIIEIEFDFRSIKLTSEMIVKLDKIIELYQKHQQGLKITIEGYADQVGNQIINQNISEKRALEVRHYFLKNGITAKQRIKTIAYGEKFLLANNNNEASRKRNRRVEVIIDIAR